MKSDDIGQSIRDIIERIGLGILEEPLRLEAFLRDLHPEQPAEISVLIESLLSGTVEQLLNRVPIHECTASLSARGGIAPRYADWAMHLWLDILPASAIQEQQEYTKQFSKGWNGSVEDVLGKYRDNTKQDETQ